MRSVESSAKKMEEAISLGLEKLDASIADVSIDIIEEGTKGFLGIGSKPFVVRLTVREEVEEADDVLNEVHLEDAVKETEKADMDSDGRVTASDARKILRISAKLD